MASAPNNNPIPKNKFTARVSQELLVFADSLKPSDQDIAIGRSHVQEVSHVTFSSLFVYTPVLTTKKIVQVHLFNF